MEPAKKTNHFLESLAPNSFELMNEKRGFKKPRTAWFFFWRRQLRNFANLTLVARRREHFWGVLVIFLVAQLPPKRGVLLHKNSLASCHRCRHSVKPRALTCPFKQSNLSARPRQNCRL